MSSKSSKSKSPKKPLVYQAQKPFDLYLYELYRDMDHPFYNTSWTCAHPDSKYKNCEELAIALQTYCREQGNRLSLINRILENEANENETK